jgi:hypothetical protein
LLLACLRKGTDPDDLGTLLGGEVDWLRLLADAMHYGVDPLVYHALETDAGRAAVPRGVMDRLARAYYQHAALNGRLYAELRRILTACARAGIPTIVLKGAAIAEQVYGNVALRPMRDLDLLVRQQDVKAADDLLRRLRYRPDESYRSGAWYLNHHHHLAPYRSSDGRVVVELHGHIVPPGAPVRVPVEDLWRRARPASIASTPTLVLAPRDFLLHLCLDVSCLDRFVGKLRTLCDIAAWVARCGDEIEWLLLLEDARDYRAERFVYYPLWLARSLVRAEIPPYVLRDLESSIRRPSLEDLCLKLTTRRAVLSRRQGAFGVPAWILARTCGDLLNAVGARAAIRAMRPLDLIARAGRVVGRRACRSLPVA